MIMNLAVDFLTLTLVVVVVPTDARCDNAYRTRRALGAFLLWLAHPSWWVHRLWRLGKQSKQFHAVGDARSSCGCVLSARCDKNICQFRPRGHVPTVHRNYAVCPDSEHWTSHCPVPLLKVSAICCYITYRDLLFWLCELVLLCIICKIFRLIRNYVQVTF